MAFLFHHKLVREMTTTTTATTTTCANNPYPSLSTAFLSHNCRHKITGGALGVSNSGGGLGWDNDNFLDSLSQGPEALEQANQRYREQSRYNSNTNTNPNNTNPYNTNLMASGTEDNNDAFDDGTGTTPLPNVSEDEVAMGGTSGIVGGATLTDEMKAKIKASHTQEEEATQGGRMYRELLARAQQQQQRIQQPPPPQQYIQPPPPPPQQQYIQPQQQQQQPTLSPPFNPYAAPGVPPPTQQPAFDNLSVEEQARMFRELMQQQQQQQQQQPQYQYQQQQPPMPPMYFPMYFPNQAGGLQPPPPNMQVPPPPQQQQPQNYLQQGMAPDGRRIGRNRDADAIVNTSDLYFAQLKRDSAIRNHARRTGDDTKANEVFTDPSINELKIHINPYLEEAKKKEMALLETSPEEMVLPILLEQNSRNKLAPQNASTSGVSYREKLRQRKMGTASDTGTTTTPTAPSNAPPTATPPPQQQQQQQKQQVTQPSIQAATQQPQQTMQTTTTTQQLQQQDTTRASASSSSSSSSSTQESLRTLMGLLVKHRGGPGFGAGRLKSDAEIGQFEQSVQQVLAQLQTEVPKQQQQQQQQGGVATTYSTNESTSTLGALTRTGPVAAVAAGDRASSSLQQMNEALSCLEGAMHMYRHSPINIRRNNMALMTLQATVQSALQTCNQIFFPDDNDNRNPQSNNNNSPTTVDESEMEDILSCLEGAIHMYRHSPENLRDGMVLLSLQATMQTALDACNDLVGNIKNGAPAAAGQHPPPATWMDATTVSTTTTTTTTTTTPVQTVPSPPVVEEDTTSVKAVSSPPTDPSEQASRTVSSNAVRTENNGFLEKVYRKLQNAAGDGPLGLRKDLSLEEMESLADDLVTTRRLLVDELNDTMN